ncbi:MAG: glycosyltransferase family 2 protein [Rickettsiales bacterium]|nr:glycosyltransferase family 2 protein [Rickettsiales bacterium]
MMNPFTRKLGEILTGEGSITTEARDEALNAQTGDRLGQILFRNGHCNSLALYQALAKQRDLEFVNLLESPPDKAVLNPAHLEEYLALQILPWKADPQSGLMLIAGVEFSDAQHAWAQKHYPNHRFVQTAEFDIHRTLNALFSHELSHQSIHKLALRFPIQSARILFNRSKHLPVLLLLLLSALSAGLFLTPETIVIGTLLVMSGIHFLTLSFKWLLFLIGNDKREALWNQYQEMPRLADSALPIYTILLPIYREARILPQLVTNLRALDYPKQKLDIKLILEEDDLETFERAKSLNLEGMFEIIRVPYSEPRTKPKACNYALNFAQGSIITIYDAEDRPDPQQLRDVVHRFFYGPQDLVCVQCRLNYYNRTKNLLTRLFSIEYAAWFDFMIPALDHFNLPVPLGGTSNHIYREKLIDLGEWDPFNVTEDADLGIRLASLRYRTAALYSETEEEAPVRLWPWIKQRSRWIKGYMQTWLVHMRRPIWLWNKLGWQGFGAFQLFIGGPCLVFLTTPILFTLSVIWLIHPPNWQSELAQLILPLSVGTLLYGILLHLFFAVKVVQKRNWSNMGWAHLCFPLYWLLHSAASFRALSELITRPHYWEKTEHGLWQNELEKSE